MIPLIAAAIVAALVICAEAIWLIRISRLLGGPKAILIGLRHQGGGSTMPVKPMQRLTSRGLRHVVAGSADEMGRPVLQNGVVVYLNPRSIASFRVVEALRDLNAVEPCPAKWSWILIGSDDDVKRFAAQTNPIGVVMGMKRRHARWLHAEGMPLGIYVDSMGRSRQCAFLDDYATLSSFVDGCPNTQMRSWLRRMGMSWAANQMDVSGPSLVGASGP